MMNFREQFNTRLSSSVPKLVCSHIKNDIDDVVESVMERNRLALIAHVEDFLASNAAPRNAEYLTIMTSYIYFNKVTKPRGYITKKPYLNIGIFFQDNDKRTIDGHGYLLEHSLLIDHPAFVEFDIFDYEPLEHTYTKKEVRKVRSDIFEFPERYSADARNYAIQYIQDYFRELVQMDLTIKI